MFTLAGSDSPKSSKVAPEYPAAKTSHDGIDPDSIEVAEGQPRDPMDFCDHIPSEIKRIRQRVCKEKILKELTSEQKVSYHQSNFVLFNHQILKLQLFHWRSLFECHCIIWTIGQNCFRQIFKRWCIKLKI